MSIPGAPEPSPINHYRADQIQPILDSYAALLERPLLHRSRGESVTEWALRAYTAPFVLLAHDGGADPRFTYANRMAQELFEMPWSLFAGMPSRRSAEPDEQAARDALLSRVLRDGFCEDYSGIRVAASGRRFRITGATVWNVYREDGRRMGQAASFVHWQAITH
jgi:MEKHLA domain